MPNLLHRYAHWLHLRWPAGTVERLPEVGPDGATNVPGLFVTGDLSGVPLLKFALDSGARAVRRAAADLGPGPRAGDRDDLVIIGGGVSGIAAAVEAKARGLRFRVLEAAEPFSTVANFPRGKPIYTYPPDMTPAGRLQVRATVKEALQDELRSQMDRHGIAVERARATAVRGRDGDFRVELEEGAPLPARKVIVAVGRNGDFRRLGVPGEALDKVMNRLHDPRDYAGSEILVAGGGDSALEAAIALARAGGKVTLVHRGGDFARAKPENAGMVEALVRDPSTPAARVEHPVSERTTTAADDFSDSPHPEGRVTILLESRVKEIRERDVVLETPAGPRTLANDVVFTMIGREAPLDLFRRSGVRILGTWTTAAKVSLALVLLLAVFVYHWKSSAATAIPVYEGFKARHWFPFHIGSPTDPASLPGSLRISMQSPSFYYSLAYCLAVLGFGIRRIRRRRTPYVAVQTWTLVAIQWIPLFLLPYIFLPWAGHNGWFDAGAGKGFADAFFPATEWDPHGREYWRAVGFILAWPLMFWNVFTDQPLGAWLWVSFAQTFVLIPALVFVWGKGAYCGWICSCGALAETVGDTLRHKMPHGPRWNRLNLVGQAALVAAFVLLLLRVASWLVPEGSAADRALTGAYMGAFLGRNAAWANLPFPLTFLNYNWIVDVTLAGILGVGLYWHMSGRMWCRFACPLAALMHVYARFSRFRILADKKKCISCNVCTSVCHQGIDVMNFANKGIPMADPQCVRCSACVQSCPTGVLEFGRVDGRGNEAARDRLAARTAGDGSG